MSLTKAIKFRHLISQLTQEECVEFLSKLVVNSHMDIVVTSLFRHFAKTNQINTINSFNETLSDIIQSRKEEQKAIVCGNIKICQWPYAIIGHTASFLDQCDYFRFSSSSRSIYLGCNSPNLLHKLNVSNFANYSRTNLQRFPSVNNLAIDPLQVPERTEFEVYDSPIFNQVTTLQLDACHQNDEWVEQLFARNIVNCNTVTRLYCNDFGDDDLDDVKMDRKEFLNLLSRLPNLKHIKLYQLCVTDDLTAKDIFHVCPNVIGLATVGGNSQLNANLITLFASKLKCLLLVQYYKNEFDFNNCSFAKLEELDMFTPDNTSLQSILKSASNVKKIAIRTESPGESDALMSNVDIKHAMENIVVKCPFLKHVYVETKPNHFCSVLEGVECGLLKTKRLNRTELKIHIICNEWNSEVEVKANTIALNVGRVVNSLESSAINDFMFIWDLSEVTDDVDDDLSKQIFTELCNISVHTKVFQHQHIVIIANRHCKINGYVDLICGE